MRLLCSLTLMVLLLSACNLSAERPTPTPERLTPAPTTGRPEVQITTISPGENVALNQQVTFNVQVSDTLGVSLVTLAVDGTRRDSASLTGATNSSVTLDYTPTSIGSDDIQIVAQRADGTASIPAVAQIIVGAAPTATRAVSTTGGTTGGVPTNDPRRDPNDPTCRVLIDGAGVNLRSQPTLNANNILRVLPAGSSAPVIGRNADSSWYQVRANLDVGWVSSTVVTLFGQCGNIPVVAGATATPLPTWTPLPATNTAPASATPGRPDLVIPSISGELTVQANASAVRTYSVVVTNTGTGTTAVSFIVRTTINQSPPQVFESASSSLEPGQSITLSVSTTFPTAGTYTISAVADSNNTVTNEISEVNNTGTITVTVNP